MISPKDPSFLHMTAKSSLRSAFSNLKNTTRKSKRILSGALRGLCAAFGSKLTGSVKHHHTILTSDSRAKTMEDNMLAWLFEVGRTVSPRLRMV